MIYTIKNDELTVQIKKKGAELCSVKNKQGFEFIWQAESVWPRHAPNLFPIIGSLIDHQYVYEGKTYDLRHHGFARDTDFDLLHQSEHSACFVLQNNNENFKLYPFNFTLLIIYTLEGNSLQQRFRVINDDTKTIPMSFGGHPAFNVESVADYEIKFNKLESGQPNLLEGPYISEVEENVLEGDTITLTTSIFDKDALVFQQLNSTEVTLQHKKTNHAVRVEFAEFPFLGIWAKPGANFVCIEPWQGLADLVNHNKEIKEKKGMLWLEKEQEVTKTFAMTFTL